MDTDKMLEYLRASKPEPLKILFMRFLGSLVGIAIKMVFQTVIVVETLRIMGVIK